MPVVDSHCHASPLWYEPVETLLYQMDTNGVDAAVLIQMQGQFDNSYQQSCLRRYPSRFASVVLVDHTRADASDQLRRLADDGASGIRLKATDRSPGDDPLALWRTAAAAGLTISCPVPPDTDVDEFSRLLEELPGLTVVLEHLAGSSRDAEDPHGTHRGRAFPLARHPNTCIKIPGLGEFSNANSRSRAIFPSRGRPRADSRTRSPRSAPTACCGAPTSRLSPAARATPTPCAYARRSLRANRPRRARRSLATSPRESSRFGSNLPAASGVAWALGPRGLRGPHLGGLDDQVHDRIFDIGVDEAVDAQRGQAALDLGVRATRVGMRAQVVAKEQRVPLVRTAHRPRVDVHRPPAHRREEQLPPGRVRVVRPRWVVVFHTPRTCANPAAANNGDSRPASSSATLTWMSRMSFAATPAIYVDPM